MFVIRVPQPRRSCAKSLWNGLVINIRVSPPQNVPSRRYFSRTLRLSQLVDSVRFLLVLHMIVSLDLSTTKEPRDDQSTGTSQFISSLNSCVDSPSGPISWDCCDLSLLHDFSGYVVQASILILTKSYFHTDSMQFLAIGTIKGHGVSGGGFIWLALMMALFFGK